jgi:2-oxo-4-hydroxy-4-carboxy-5-ureidoimidazoline decarboxylase
LAREALPHAFLNALAEDAARAALTRCCAAKHWVEAMLARRPFVSTEALLAAGDEESLTLARSDVLDAFSHHPEIGSDLEELRKRVRGTASLSESEQSRVAEADEATLMALREGNREYRERFGYLFIVCASGKSAGEMLALLRARLGNDPDTKIAHLRLAKLSS